MQIQPLLTQIIFYCFSALLLVSGLMTITSRNPVRSALFLVLAFFASAGLWILLQAEFLALILIVVYVGAVMTLFLFVVMMIDIDLAELRKGFVKYLPLGALILVAMVALMMLVIAQHQFGAFIKTPPVLHPPEYSNLAELGSVLYTEYVYPFELAAVLLLIAIISSISMAHRGPRQRKSQKINEQVKVNPEDRLRLVKVATDIEAKQTPDNQFTSGNTKPTEPKSES